jgi:hypothetical protein
LGMSTKTRERIEADAHQSGYSNTTKSYATHRPRPRGMTDEEFERLSIPIELRVVFYPETASTRMASQRWESLPTETRANAARYYYNSDQYGRHPVVPRGETLHLISHDVADDGHAIYYYIPGSVRDDYNTAVKRESSDQST